MWRAVILSCSLLLGGNACALEGDPFGISNLTAADIEKTRKIIIKDIGVTVLANTPSRVSMSEGYIKVLIYTWTDISDIFHPLVILFARDMNKKFSRNVCDYLEQYPDALIGTVYVEYHTVLFYERGGELKTNLEFQESTECRPGLEKLFQERLSNPRK